MAVETRRQRSEQAEVTESRESASTSSERIVIQESTSTSGGSDSPPEDATKSFNLDEWGKPMGLPSPPETLGLDPDLASLTKQSTTHGSKQESNYKENKTADDSSKNFGHPEKESGNEKSNKETDSLPEKECSHGSDNKLSEKIDPVYIDLTYVPHFGDPHYCNVEFFRRIRSRYYVFSGTKPSKEVFNALLEAKQDWKDKEARVTIIPTYETDTLGYWMAVNHDALVANNIDVAPSASRCTINLQDHETSCSAYRLEL